MEINEEPYKYETFVKKKLKNYQMTKEINYIHNFNFTKS
jgi:hypothetical protein